MQGTRVTMEEREIKMKLTICRLQGWVGWCLLVLFSFVLISFSVSFFPPGVLRLLKAYIIRDRRLFISNLTKELGPDWIKCLTLWQHLQKGLWLTPLQNLHREVSSCEEAWGWGAGEGGRSRWVEGSRWEKKLDQRSLKIIWREVKLVSITLWIKRWKKEKRTEGQGPTLIKTFRYCILSLFEAASHSTHDSLWKSPIV